MATFTYNFKTAVYTGDVTFNTGLFINGEWVEPVDKGTVEIVNPATGQGITTISAGSSKDVDIAVDAALQAYKTRWGLKVPGAERGKILLKLADLIERDLDQFAALEALNVGKTYGNAKLDVVATAGCFRYFGGYADKLYGKTVESNEAKFTYTRHQPYGVVASIIPWNFPLIMVSWKLAPALATGNTVILKPSEITPLTALKFASLCAEAGVPPGVVNIVVGYGHTVGQALIEHPKVAKIAFTGSTLVGRKILKASAESNLKVTTLELGGKSPAIVFDDADLDAALKWIGLGIFFNMGQVCAAGSRIFIQEGIYDEFIKRFSEYAQGLTAATGDPFAVGTAHGPQVSKTQFERVMGYIDSGKTDGAHVLVGGERHGDTGYFIKPTIFTECNPQMKIVREEIFGPVAVVMKFKTEEDVIELANDTVYGLACSVYSTNVSRAIRVAHAIEAGTVWVNCATIGDNGMPFGGFKQSGHGRELGEYALEAYTQVKSVHVNLGIQL